MRVNGEQVTSNVGASLRLLNHLLPSTKFSSSGEYQFLYFATALAYTEQLKGFWLHEILKILVKLEQALGERLTSIG
jgi:hypothetical protein